MLVCVTFKSALSIGPRVILSWASFSRAGLNASPNAGQFLAFSEEMRNRFIAYLSERLEDYIDDGGIAIPRENHFLIATR